MGTDTTVADVRAGGGSAGCRCFDVGGDWGNVKRWRGGGSGPTLRSTANAEWREERELIIASHQLSSATTRRDIAPPAGVGRCCGCCGGACAVTQKCRQWPRSCSGVLNTTG